MPVQTKDSARKRKLNRSQKKKVVKTSTKLPNSFIILKQALGHLWDQKRLYFGIFIFYFALYAIFVKGLAASLQLSETKELLNEAFEGELGAFETSLTLFGGLLGSVGSTAGEAANVYQMILYIIFSLVIISGLRRTFEDKNSINLKQVFYQSSYPLIPFVLVGLVIVLQCIPALLGLTLFSVIVSNGIAVAAWEQILWFTLMIIGLGLTAFFVSSSIFAGYIVTLPNMTPINALRSARKLVRYRRYNIIRKFLFLPFMGLLFASIVFLPLVFYLPLAAEILFMISSLIAVFVLHAYFYTLYRKLI